MLLPVLAIAHRELEWVLATSTFSLPFSSIGLCLAVAACVVMITSYVAVSIVIQKKKKNGSKQTLKIACHQLLQLKVMAKGEKRGERRSKKNLFLKNVAGCYRCIIMSTMYDMKATPLPPYLYTAPADGDGE